MMGAALVPSACRAAGACLLICFYIMISSQLVVMAAKSTYLTDKRNVCFKCPPGTKVQEDCKEDPSATEPTDPVCVPCDNLSYADKENGEKYCKECWPGNCLANQEEAQQCTKTTNRACRCLNGFFAFYLDKIDLQIECRPHTVCKPGDGEVYPGNATHDTRCQRCEEGKQFVNASDPAHPKCQDNSTDANSTTPPKNTKTSERSGYLDGAAIFGLVYAVQVVLTIAVGVMIFCEKKRKEDPHAANIKGKLCSRPSIFFCVLTFLPLIGLIFPTILIVKIACGNRDRTTARTQGNTELGEFAAAPHDGLGQAPATSASSNSSSCQQNGQQNGAAVRATATSWSKEFIQTKVFNLLSKLLGIKWEQFMHLLPGFAGVNIAHKKDENRYSVPNQISACLVSWHQQSPCEVTQDNIYSALKSVERLDVIEKLEQELENLQCLPAPE